MKVTKSIAASAAAILPLALAGTALAGEDDKGAGNPHGTPPGQVNKQQTPAQQRQATPQNNGARSHGAGKPAKAPKPAKKQPKAKAPKAFKPRPAAPRASKPKPASPAGKTTICHATGSATNPYVTITVSKNALPAHTRHQDGRDIVPAPAAGCPSGSEAPAAAKKPDAAKDKGRDKVTICHATGSETNPYVTITIAEPAVRAHERHQDGEDIIPAPAEGCPGGTTTAAAPRTASSFGIAAPVAPATPAAPGSRMTPRAMVLGETLSGGPALADVEDEEAAVAAETVRRESGAAGKPTATGRLPFTGLDLVLLVVTGLGALLAGIALRRSVTRRGTA